MLHLCKVQVKSRIGIAVSGCILICGSRTRILAKTAVAFSHLECYLATEGTFLPLGKLVIYLAICLGGIEILATLHLLVCRGNLRATTSSQQRGNKAQYYPV